MAFLLALGAVFIVSLASLLGVVALAFSTKTLKDILTALVALAAGTLVGDALLHLLPEAAREGFSVMTGGWILLGILAFFVIEKFIHWHHCHKPHMCNDPHDASKDHSGHTKTFGWMILIGDGLHNFLDGALIAASFLVNTSLGIATTLAVLFHEIPQEIADFGVLLHAGFSKAKALFLNFLSAIIALLGVIVVFLATKRVESLETILIPVTAGAFIYIAVADLIPEIKHDEKLAKSMLHLFMFVLGILLMTALLFLE